jgi:hypothetical protein
MYSTVQTPSIITNTRDKRDRFTTTTIIKIRILWDITLCSLLKIGFALCILLGSCTVYSSNLKKYVAYSSGISFQFYRIQVGKFKKV